MLRLLVFWTRPYHVSALEAEAWACDELRGLAASDAVARADLSRLKSPWERHPRTSDWMLELHLAAGRDSAEASRLDDWVRDLRLLGMRPSVVLVDGTIVLAPEGT